MTKPRKLQRVIKSVKSNIYLARENWHGKTDLADFEHGMSSGWYQTHRDYQSPAEKQLAVAIATELRPKETLRPVRALLRKKDRVTLGFDVLIPESDAHDATYVQQMRLFQDRFAARRPKSAPLTRPWSAPVAMTSPTNRPTGQIILVPPTPMHIPYGIVTNCENQYRNHIERVAEYNFGMMANLSGGRALDEALNARRTTTSIDRNFSKWSQENNWSDDDIVSEVATPVSLGYEHSTTGKARDFKTLPSATMHGYVDHGSEFWGVLRLSELECCAAEEFVERVLLREFLEFYDNASKADDNMSDRKIAASIRAAWKYPQRWDFPALRHPATVFYPTVPRSDYFRDEITKYLRRITTDRVRRLREKWQKMQTAEARKNTKAMWDATRKAMTANRRLIEALKSGAENDSTPVLSIT